MPQDDAAVLFDRFCTIQASFESSRQVYRRIRNPGEVRRFFNSSFTAFELRRYMLDLYYKKGSFTVSELVAVSEFSRPTVAGTVSGALKAKLIDEIPRTKDRRRREFKPTAASIQAWKNYCNALLRNPEFIRVLRVAQTLVALREFAQD